MFMAGRMVALLLQAVVVLGFRFIVTVDKQLLAAANSILGPHQGEIDE